MYVDAANEANATYGVLVRTRESQSIVVVHGAGGIELNPGVGIGERVGEREVQAQVARDRGIVRIAGTGFCVGGVPRADAASWEADDRNREVEIGGWRV